MSASASRIARPTPSEYVLLVTDMQPGFPASQDAITQWFVEQEIVRAIELGMAVVVLEYDAYELGETLPRLMRHLQGYQRLAVVGRAPRQRGQLSHERDNGAEEVIQACLEHGFGLEHFRVCGVNSDACIKATIRGLADSISTCHLTVVQDACNSDNGRDPSVFRDVLWAVGKGNGSGRSFCRSFSVWDLFRKRKTMTTRNTLHACASEALRKARERLYTIAGGSCTSGDVRAARLTTAQRTEYFRSAEFRDWVADERAHGRQVFWLKDVDKTQGAGDVFTFFFKWRLDNGKMTSRQLAAIKRHLLKRQRPLARAATHLTRLAFSVIGLHRTVPAFADLSPNGALRLWETQEAGGKGMGLFEFWQNVYWPSQVGMTRAEKLAQVNAYAPLYAAKVYPGVAEENRALTEAGVEVVIVTNGDQELAIAIAPVLGIKPENVVGSHMIYDGQFATGKNHSYEVSHEDWLSRPQPGKTLSLHYWMHINRKRWGWEHLDEDRFVIGGRDGDSASSDGGMMIYLPTPAIGNFMIDTPGEPDRLVSFQAVAAKYGWTKGKYITLVQQPSLSGRVPE